MATDWAALRVEYVNGAMQYKELAEAHGLKEGTVRQRANSSNKRITEFQRGFLEIADLLTQKAVALKEARCH